MSSLSFKSGLLFLLVRNSQEKGPLLHILLLPVNHVLPLQILILAIDRFLIPVPCLGPVPHPIVHILIAVLVPVPVLHLPVTTVTGPRNTESITNVTKQDRRRQEREGESERVPITRNERERDTLARTRSRETANRNIPRVVTVLLHPIGRSTEMATPLPL